MVVFGAVADERRREQVVRLLAPSYQCSFFATGAQLVEAVTSRCPDCVVLSLDIGADALLSALERALGRHPRLAAVVCLPQFDKRVAYALVRLGRVAAPHLAFPEDDLESIVRAAVSANTVRPLSPETAARLSRLVPPDLIDFFDYCLVHGDKPLTVPAVARAIGVHRNTLVGRLSRSGFPPPSKVIDWVRVLTAMHQHLELGWTIERTALAFQFGSDAALRTALKRHTGYTVREVRAMTLRRLQVRFLEILGQPVDAA
jgi:AraC-like DNA-binding protein